MMRDLRGNPNPEGRVPEHKDLSLPAQLETLDHAITAADLARILAVDPVTIYKQANAGRIPGCFRIGTCVRFDPKTVAAWLRGRL